MTSHRRNPSAMVDPKLSVVIPVYNEKATIDEILRRVIETPFRKEIVLVDDCSTDGTRQILEKLAQLQSSGEAQAAAFDGGDLIDEPEITAKVAKETGAYTKCLSPTLVALTRKARKSPGKTECKPFGASSAFALLTRVTSFALAVTNRSRTFAR